MSTLVSKVLFFVNLLGIWRPMPGCTDTEQGLHYEPLADAWQLVGSPEDTAHYQLPGMEVDLVRVGFPGQHNRRIAWVVAGIETTGGRLVGRYVPLGPWSNRAEFEQALTGRPLLRVQVGPSPPCQGDDCDILKLFEESEIVISEQFVTSGGHAPGWYPWGVVLGSLNLEGNGCAYQPNVFSMVSAYEHR